VLPQALRIAIPPMTNQYLNLTKNSSLAVAIGYPEVTGIVVVMVNNGSPAPQAFAVLMLVYLVFSLGISAVANVVNRRLVLRGN
jgi:general L-amino acid transport system permease protein